MYFRPNPRKIERVCHVFSEFTIKGEITVVPYLFFCIKTKTVTVKEDKNQSNEVNNRGVGDRLARKMSCTQVFAGG